MNSHAKYGFDNKPVKVCIVGTQGLPACYGGFETLVENITREKHSNDVKYIVFCSSCDLKTSLNVYNGSKLVYVPIHANGVSSILYDIVSLIKSAFLKPRCVLILGVSGCIFLPIFRIFSRSRVVVNVDGVEYKRAKWSMLAKMFLRFSERVAVLCSDELIADNKGIADYLKATYNCSPKVIAYGGDHVLKQCENYYTEKILKKYGLISGRYAITVCRIEPENNCHMILDAESQNGIPAIFIGNWEKSSYGRSLRNKYKHFKNINLIDPLFDIDELYVLRANAKLYIHGHSAGGTNPSLVEAMFFGKPILAYDVVFNRETTFGEALYFKDAESLVSLLKIQKIDGTPLLRMAKRYYRWAYIAEQYEALFF